MPNIQVIDQENSSRQVSFDRMPDECPLCHNKISPNLSQAFLNTRENISSLQIIFRCPNRDCHNIFIGYYFGNGSVYKFNTSGPKKIISKNFSEIINQISPDFILIYSQAYIAEQENLDVICGVGYRKALEFLIKDYLISQKVEDVDKIKKEVLGYAIDNRVANKQLKEVAKRAVWLGNDETHYERKWQDKDLVDLKDLIELTIKWIETEKLTEKLLQDMPEQK